MPCFCKTTHPPTSVCRDFSLLYHVFFPVTLHTCSSTLSPLTFVLLVNGLKILHTWIHRAERICITDAKPSQYGRPPAPLIPLPYHLQIHNGSCTGHVPAQKALCEAQDLRPQTNQRSSPNTKAGSSSHQRKRHRTSSSSRSLQLQQQPECRSYSRPRPSKHCRLCQEAILDTYQPSHRLRRCTNLALRAHRVPRSTTS